MRELSRKFVFWLFIDLKIRGLFFLITVNFYWPYCCIYFTNTLWEYILYKFRYIMKYMNSHEEILLQKKKLILTRILIESWFFQVTWLKLAERITLLKKINPKDFLWRYVSVMSKEKNFMWHLQKYLIKRMYRIQILMQNLSLQWILLEESIDTNKSSSDAYLENELSKI